MKRTANIRHTTPAFTLVEVIVALTVLGTSITAVFGVLSVCSRASHHSRMLTQAVCLAEYQMVTLMASDPNAFGMQEGESGHYAWQVDVSPTPVEDLAAVKVVVTWNEQARPQTFELLSLVRLKSFTEKGN